MTRNIRIVLAVLVLAGAGFGYWHFLLGPKRVEVQKLAEDKQNAEASIAQAQTTLASYESARKAYPSLYVDVVRLGKAVPSDDDMRSLVLQLDTSASRSGVDFDSVQVSGGGATASSSSASTAAATEPPPPGATQIGAAGFAQMPFQFTFGGTFGELGSFISRLDRLVTIKGDKVDVNGRLLRIESISLAPAQDGFPALQADISASSYLAPAQKGLSGAATEAAASASAAAASTPATTSTTTQIAG